MKLRRGTLEEVRRLRETETAKDAYEEEILFGKVQEQLVGLMEKHGLRQQDLASRLDVTPGRISQMLSGGENMTLRTLARIGRALDARFDVTACSLHGEPIRWEDPEEVRAEIVALHGPAPYDDDRLEARFHRLRADGGP